LPCSNICPNIQPFFFDFTALFAAEIVIEDKSVVEQMRLIHELDEDDKQTIFRLINKMLTNKKFKDFFQKNIAAL